MKDVPRERMIYQKWGYDPYGDVVHLNDDHKDHEQRGYANRIDGGWELTDIDHKKVEDPYLIRRIIESLGGKPSVYENRAIEPRDYNFEKLHYGQPLPRER